MFIHLVFLKFLYIAVVAFNAFAKVGLVVFFLVQGSTAFTSGHPVSRRSKPSFAAFARIGSLVPWESGIRSLACPKLL